MKERPILFSAPMVRALLNGSKTQTRRVIKPQPDILPRAKLCLAADDEGIELHLYSGGVHLARCPYGNVGDQLWVRESFQPIWSDQFIDGYNKDDDQDFVDYKTGHGYEPSYPATDGIQEFYDHTKDDISQKVWPSIHMPRWASRITLEITAIGIEPLNNIAAEDAIAEGISECGHLLGDRAGDYSPDVIYSALWESINGQGSWAANPWVWVVEFKVIKPAQDWDEKRIDTIGQNGNDGLHYE